MAAATVEDITRLPRIAAPSSASHTRSVRSIAAAPAGLEGEGFPVRRAFAGVDLALLDPVAWSGPFVMNTEDEIEQAFADFRAGKLGTVPLDHPLTSTHVLAAETDSHLD